MEHVTTESVIALLQDLEAAPPSDLNDRSSIALKALLAGRESALMAENVKGLDDELSQRMVAAGMIPLSEIGDLGPLGAFMRHAAVKTPDNFVEWLRMKHREYTRMQLRFQLEKSKEDSEIYDFVMGKASAFRDVMANAEHVFGITPDTSEDPAP